MKDVSSLMDGELDARKARSTIQRVEDQDELWDAWSTFHVIRDTLQGNPVVPGRFNQRLHERLLREPAPPPPPWWRRPRGARGLRIGGVAVVIGVLAGLALIWRMPPVPVPVTALHPPALEAGIDEPRLAERVSAHRPMLPLDAAPRSSEAVEARP